MSSLLLRRPTPLDLEAAKRVHCDPETNRFNPSGPPSAADVEEMLRLWTAHWDAHSFGYWAVSDRETPEAVLGFGGIMWKPIGDRHGLNM